MFNFCDMRKLVTSNTRVTLAGGHMTRRVAVSLSNVTD